MKRQLQLGNLATRFFSYVQMRKKRTVQTGEIAPILGLSSSQEKDLLRRLGRSGWILRLRRGLYLIPPRLPAGGQYSPGVYVILDELMKDANGTYQICGPSAFSFYGFDNQIPAVTYAYNNRISGNRRIGGLSFQLIKVADDRLGDTTTSKAGDGAVAVYSSRARTLVDVIYDWSKFNGIPRGYGWISNDLSGNRTAVTEIVQCAVRYGNQATIRRIGFFLDRAKNTPTVLRRLRRELSKARSLIPLDPTKPARGSINRTWGIIVND